MSTLSVLVLVQAYPDELKRMDIDSRRDSFCGKLSVRSNLISRVRIPPSPSVVEALY